VLLDPRNDGVPVSSKAIARQRHSAGPTHIDDAGGDVCQVPGQRSGRDHGCKQLHRRQKPHPRSRRQVPLPPALFVWANDVCCVRDRRPPSATLPAWFGALLG